MTEKVSPPEAEIDVDSLDDKAFEELKGKMRGDEPGEPETKTDEPAESEAQKAERARDEQGRFTKAEDKAEERPDDEAKADKPKPDTVPHAKFNQANERRKQAEAERDKAVQRLRELLELQQQPREAAKPVEVPKVTEDPVKALDWTTGKVAAWEEQQVNEARARQEQEQQEAIYTQAEQAIAPVLQAEAAEDPSIVEAYNYLRNSMGRELMRMGYSEPEAVQQLNMIERQHTLFMAANQLDPGEYLKGLAGDRGWAPKPAEQVQQPAEQPNPVAKIAEREEVRKASLSLGKTGGGVANTGAVTPEQLLDMSDAEFEAFKKQHGGSVAAAFMN
jgi:hypothetical protein